MVYFIAGFIGGIIGSLIVLHFENKKNKKISE